MLFPLCGEAGALALADKTLTLGRVDGSLFLFSDTPNLLLRRFASSWSLKLLLVFAKLSKSEVLSLSLSLFDAPAGTTPRPPPPGEEAGGPEGGFPLVPSAAGAGTTWNPPTGKLSVSPTGQSTTTETDKETIRIECT